MAGWAKRLQEQAKDSFLAEDLDRSLPRIEILGDRRVIVENHRGILEYGGERMRIACGRLTLCITGEGLELRALSLRELAVSGRIHAVEYIE